MEWREKLLFASRIQASAAAPPSLVMTCPDVYRVSRLTLRKLFKKKMREHYAKCNYKTYGIRSLEVWWPNTVGLKIIFCTVFFKSLFLLNRLAKCKLGHPIYCWSTSCPRIKKWHIELSLLPQSSCSISHWTHFSGATPCSIRNEKANMIKTD